MADASEPEDIYDLVIECTITLPTYIYGGASVLTLTICSSLTQLSYLDAKHEYLWGYRAVNDAVRTQSLASPCVAVRNDRDSQVGLEVEVIRIDTPTTVKILRDQLHVVVASGYADGGLPILYQDDDGSRMVGCIGANELEHALSMHMHLSFVL